MTITYPLAFPTHTGISSGIISPESFVAVTESPWTGQQQVQANQGQRWNFSIVLPIMSKADAMIWQAFFMALNGREGTFLMGSPDIAAPAGLIGGSPQINGVGQSGQTINIDNATHSVTGWLKAGDAVQFGTGATSRLYRQLVDTNSDSSGNVVLTLWPKVTQGNIPVDNSAVITSNPKALCRMLNDNVPFNVNNALQYNHQFTCNSLV